MTAGRSTLRLLLSRRLRYPEFLDLDMSIISAPLFLSKRAPTYHNLHLPHKAGYVCAFLTLIGPLMSSNRSAFTTSPFCRTSTSPA